MPSIGHIAVGLAAARLAGGRQPQNASRAGSALAFAALALLPDLDVIAFALAVPYSAPFGHRGAAHSLLAALAAGAAAGMARPHWRFVAIATAVVASHGLLDTLTDGGLGIALLWPFSNERFFAPWRPIPVAPIGEAFLSREGLRVAAFELIWFAPLWVFALWPKRRK